MELSSTIAEAIKRRTASAALGSYLFFWLTYHWEGVYATLFTNQDLVLQKYGMLKNEYINKYFFGFHGIDDWNFYAGFIVPLILTFLFIWPIPKYILIHAYRVEQEHKTERKRVKYNEDRKVQDFAIKSTNKEVEKVEAATELSVKRQAAKKIDPTILWNEEYELFKKSKHFNNFNFIIESIYSHAGKIRDDWEDYMQDWNFKIPNTALVYFDSNGLISLSAGKDKIDFTEKGRYFLKSYSQTQ